MSFYYQKKHGHCEIDHCKKDDRKLDRVMKEKCKKDRFGKTVVDFEYFVADPNIFDEDNPTLLPADRETPVAAITFKDIQEKSKVLLQALAHVFYDGVETDPSVILRIRKFEGKDAMLPLNGELIYETPELEVEDEDGIASQVSALHVDKKFKDCEPKVTYVLTLESIDYDIYLVRPITFTGTEIN